MHKTKLGILFSTSLALILSMITFGDSLHEPEVINAMPAYSYTNSPTNEPKYYQTSTFTGIGSYSQKTATYDRINVESVWSSYRGEKIKVGIIDTGCNLSHDDLNGATISNKSYDVYSNTVGTSKIGDTSGHGTQTASCIAAAINNIGGTGIAPNVELYVIRAVANDNSFPEAYLKSALEYCLKEHVDVINMSIQVYSSSFDYSYVDDMKGATYSGTITGGWTKSKLQTQINKCYQAGIPVIAAAGNYNTTVTSYPAANDHVISVGSTGLNSDTAKAGFSNYGDWIDVVAPGYILGPAANSNTDYVLTGGTSFSSPIVAGAVALYKSKYPSATPDEIEERLKDTCSDVDFSGSGSGQIDVAEFLNNGEGDAWVDATGITLNDAAVEPNDSIQLVPEFSPSNATRQTCYWTSSNTSVATVDVNGVVTGKAVGDATITATSIDGGFTDACRITVGNNIPVQSITISPKTLSLEPGETYTVTATLDPINASDQDYMFESDDEDIATVDVVTGEVTAKAVGTCNIIVHSDYDYDIIDTCSLTVTSSIVSNYYKNITAVDSSGLSAQLHNLMFDTHTYFSSYTDCKTPSIVYQLEPGSNSNYVLDFYTQKDIAKTWGFGNVGTWNREHVWCQSLSKKGNTDTQLYGESGAGSDLHHLRPTESTLNSARNNSPYGVVSSHSSSIEKYSKTTSGATAYLGGWKTGDVFEPLDTVKGDVARIVMYVYTHYATGAGGSTPSGKSSYVGDIRLNRIMQPSTDADAKALLLQWHKADPVDDKERVRNEAAFNIQGNRNPYIDHPEYADIVFGDGTEVVPVTGVSLNKPSTSLYIGQTETLTATVSPNNATNKNVNWSSNNNAVATVDSSGKITAVSEGTATISVKTIDGNYSKSCTVTIKPIAVTGVTLNKSSTSIQVGKYETLTATVSPSGATHKDVTWSSDNNSVATVDQNGKVTAVSVGNATITVTTTDGNYTDRCNVTVTPVLVTSVSVKGNKSSMSVGETFKFNVSVTPSSATDTSVTWYSTNTNVLTVDQTGLVTAVAHGTAEIYAVANDTSQTESNHKSITVNAVLQSISFSGLKTAVEFLSNNGLYIPTVYANYNDSTSVDITNELKTGSSISVDTSVVGNHHIIAKYSTFTVESDVFVTNSGAEQKTETIEGSTTKTTISTKTFYSNGTTKVGNDIFEINSSSTKFESCNSEKGQQIGTAAEPAKTLTIAKRNKLTVSRVVVNASGANNIVGTLKVRAGSTYFTYRGTLSQVNSATASVAAVGDNYVNLTNVATDYVFEGTGKGDVVAEYEQTSSVGLYFKSFEVTTQTTQVQSFDGREQAESWATYFINTTRGSNGPCLKSNETEKIKGLKAIWNDMKTEYDAMEDDGKNAFCDQTTSTLVAECLKHYRYIVDTYGSSGLEDFVVDSSGDHPVLNSSQRLFQHIVTGSTITIAIISVVGIAAIAIYIAYKRKKHI